ncbi:MAG: CcdB family protein [Gammaproteobacteria bacterium]
MAQFNVHRNPNRETKKAFPLLLDIQSDLIGALDTRVVVPLRPASSVDSKHIEVLTPIFEIAGRRYVMLTPQLAGIHKRELGEKVDDLVRCRNEIIAALDLLITGI